MLRERDLRNAGDNARTSKDEEGSQSWVGLDKVDNAGHGCLVCERAAWRVGKRAKRGCRREERSVRVGWEKKDAGSPFIPHFAILCCLLSLV